MYSPINSITFACVLSNVTHPKKKVYSFMFSRYLLCLMTTHYHLHTYIFIFYNYSGSLDMNEFANEGK